MKIARRDFIALLGGAATWPMAARAQQMPVVGFLHSGAAAPNATRLVGFRQGLSEAGFVEGHNLAIEFRWADGHNERLAELAADLVRRQVAVIATPSSTVAAVAAKKATATIPMVFIIAEDPVKLGLVASLSRPGGNATGVTTLNTALTAKRIGLLRELVPQASSISVLLNPANPSTEQMLKDFELAARALGVQLDVARAGNDAEIEAAFGKFAARRGDPLLVATDPFFFLSHAKIAVLAARHGIPAMFDNREYSDSGGLMSYGTNIVSVWQQAGDYVGRILKGEKPADLPVTQPTKFELVINLSTAKALGIAIPSTLLALADEVIE